MIISFLFGSLLYLLSGIFSFMPTAVKIPYVDSYLVSGFSYFTAFLAEFPPLQVVWQCFVWYMLFKIGLMIVKFFIGHRINI